ncbi:MAG: SPOR domain-containing protein [Pseudomonadota bacterium]|nr:SPOR domain-containing protein [Pseudomonadota bacterium]
METEDTQSPKSKLRLFVFVGIFVGLGAIIFFFVWPQLSLKTPADLIIVKAVDGPIKVKPLDRGGTTVAHQDLLVIDMLKNGIANNSEFETLHPNPSTPEPPPIDGGKSEDKMAKGGAVMVGVENVTSTTKVVSVDPKQQTSQQKRPKKADKKLLVEKTGEPSFVIQLAAFRSAKKAEEIASLLSEKHGSRLDGIKLHPVRLDTVSNGIFFRVVSPPMSRAVAETTCINLRRAGQDCFLRKFTASDG